MLFRSQGIKAARQSLEGGVLYAWLYRHDRDWLVHWNQQHQQERLAPAPRVDWNQRDRIAVRQLLRIIKRLDSSLDHPRRSEEHTSELQSRGHLVCRLLLEKEKRTTHRPDRRARPPQTTRGSR